MGTSAHLGRWPLLLTAPISRLLVLISEPVNPALWPQPVSWITLIHAARVSVLYRSLAVSSPARVSFSADLAGFLLMAWGGSIVSHVLLGLPVPQLLSFTPFLLYSFIHLALPSVDQLPTIKTLDTLLPLLDALVRTNTIAGAVELCRQHPLRDISSSLSAQIFIASISASAGGIMAQAIRVWEPSWRLCRPNFLEVGSILASTDIWSGALIAALYGCLTLSHPFYDDLQAILFSQTSSRVSPHEAKALSALVLTFIFVWRACMTHHLTGLSKMMPLRRLGRWSKPKKD